MTGNENRQVSRRAVLRSAALAGALGGSGGLASRASAAQTRPEFPEYVREARGGAYADLRGESSATVAVGAGRTKFAFDPAFVWVDPGTTVTFEWVSDNHNVVHWSRPAGSDWRGTGPTIYDTGHTHTHTFETPGMYTYYCQPHDQLEMKGAVAVGPDVPTTDEPIADEAPAFMGVPLPSTPIQWGVAAVATLGMTALATAGTWLWWHSIDADVDGYDVADPLSGVEGRTDTTDPASAGTGWADGTDRDGRTTRTGETGDALANGIDRLDRHVRRAVEHRERAEAALTDGEADRAREALDRAATALDRADAVVTEHDIDAGDRVAAEREVVAALRERCERE